MTIPSARALRGIRPPYVSRSPATRANAPARISLSESVAICGNIGSRTGSGRAQGSRRHQIYHDLDRSADVAAFAALLIAFTITSNWFAAPEQGLQVCGGGVISLRRSEDRRACLQILAIPLLLGATAHLISARLGELRKTHPHSPEEQEGEADIGTISLQCQTPQSLSRYWTTPPYAYAIAISSTSPSGAPPLASPCRERETH